MIGLFVFYLMGLMAAVPMAVDIDLDSPRIWAATLAWPLVLLILIFRGLKSFWEGA